MHPCSQHITGHIQRVNPLADHRVIILPAHRWRIGLELINPVAWLIGGPTWTYPYRTLTVWVDEDGRAHARTTGSVPRGWPQQYSWEIPDGPIGR